MGKEEGGKGRGDEGREREVQFPTSNPTLTTANGATPKTFFWLRH